jgi:hypothetical protein
MYFESFLKLPVELVSQILSFLEYQDLLRCSEVRFPTLFEPQTLANPHAGLQTTSESRRFLTSEIHHRASYASHGISGVRWSRAPI